MVPQPRAGSLSPSPAHISRLGHVDTPRATQPGALSATSSPNTNSLTGSNPLSKIVIAQVYLLLSTIKEDKDSSKWGLQAEQLRKLVDENNMEVFSKYFVRLVAGNAALIFPGIARGTPTSGNYHLLTGEMLKLAQDKDQASRIAESIEGATDEIFRDFDLATFMDHFDLDPIAKTALVIAFKVGSRVDLQSKSDAILTANFTAFVDALSQPLTDPDNIESDVAFISFIIDRFIQYHPPTFNAAAKAEMRDKVHKRYSVGWPYPPTEVLAALDLLRVLSDKPDNSLALYIQRMGANFTKDSESCIAYLETRPKTIHLSEEQVSAALTYTTVSQSPRLSPAVLTTCLCSILPSSFSWQNVISYFDQKYSRISAPQFLSLYNALAPVARDFAATKMDIQNLWGGQWENAQAQLSYVCAFGSLKPQELDATTIPGLKRGIDLDIYAQTTTSVKERAALAMRHPLSSVAAISAIFHAAFHSTHTSTTTEAKRLFQEVIIPNADIFVVAAFEVPTPWGDIAFSTVASLLEQIIRTSSLHHDFVIYTLWTKHQDRIASMLNNLYTAGKVDTAILLESALSLGLFPEMVHMSNLLACELALVAHCKGILDMSEWAKRSEERGNFVNGLLNEFLLFRVSDELELQRDKQLKTGPLMPLTVHMVSVLLQVLEDSLPKSPVPQLIDMQRQCIGAYPRLVNYGEGYDDIIDANGTEGNVLRPDANSKMEEHYRKMYNNELQVRDVVELLNQYKHSRDPLDQDIFACMIHGLLDEYGHYGGYPVEALATTAVLFGGILARRLVPELPLKVGLGMVLEAVKDHHRDHPMFKFGLQALIHLFGRFPEWPGFCTQLLQIPGLVGTEPWSKAREVVRLHEEGQGNNDHVDNTAGVGVNPSTITTTSEIGATDDADAGTDLMRRASSSGEAAPHSLGEPFARDRAALQPFMAVGSDPYPPTAYFEDPDADTQGRIQFVLNNLTDVTLPSMCAQLRSLLSTTHQQWFASHLVDERAKMQPNYHHVYIELVRLIEDSALWSRVLQATYSTVRRVLNSEMVMHNAAERAQLRNLGQWLGLLTLGRDKPIKHSNIAFRQLLIEAFDSKRLMVVIPFVCRVLVQATASSIFRPPNPWLMDLIHLLVELYHHADLKLNLKFEIEVLCKDLSLDVRGIEPSHELANRPPGDSTMSGGPTVDVQMEGFDGLTLGSLGTSLVMPPALQIPDVSDMVHIPPINEMVITSSRLGDIVRKGFDYAIREIIGAVVERSVTIAAIATTNMIRKDFATEGDESRVRDCAAKMAKATAGSLALVTSKDPMRAHLTNYIRSISAELPQGLPEGTIMMCVTSNLDLGCSVIEKAAEERAVPEIEEIIRPDLEARRHHRITCPNEPFVDASLTRWAMTMPHPFKLSPGTGGLNREQMAIYEDFARQPRTPGTTSGVLTHAASGSDATRSIANDVLQEQFGSAPNLPSSTETCSLQQQQQQPQAHVQAHEHTQAPQQQHQQLPPPPPQQSSQPPSQSSQPPPQLSSQQQLQPQPQQPGHGQGQQHLGGLPVSHHSPSTLHHSSLIANGLRGLATYQVHDQHWQGALHRAQKLVQELQRVASDADEDHFHGLPRPHPVLDVVDALVQLIIKTSQTAEEFPSYAADHICQAIFGQIDDSLALESLVHVLETLRRIGVRNLESRISMFFRQQPADRFLRPSVIAALVRTNLMDWRVIDTALSHAVDKRDPDALANLAGLLELTVLNDRPVLHFSDLTQTLEAAWACIQADDGLDIAVHRELQEQLLPPSLINLVDSVAYAEKELMEYVFEEWVHRHQNPNATELGAVAFLSQLQATGIIHNKDALFVFLRVGIDMSVAAFDQDSHPSTPVSEALVSADAVVHLVGLLLRVDCNIGYQVSTQFVDSVVSLLSVLLAHHHTTRGTAFNQKVFYRLFAGILEEVAAFSDDLVDTDRLNMMCGIATRLEIIGPRHLPGFAQAWLLLVQHRALIGCLAGRVHGKSWSALTRLLCQQLEFLGELLKSSTVSTAAKDVYRATLKLLFVLQHDFPDFIAACCMPLCAAIPAFCTQLLGTVLTSAPSSIENNNTTTAGSVEKDEDSVSIHYATSVLTQRGLKALVDLVMERGPSEDAAAHLARAFILGESETSFGHIPVEANSKLIGAFVIYAGHHALESENTGLFSNGPEASIMALLVRELPAAPRFYLLWWIVNQLRFPGPMTNYFHRLILEIFGHDLGDPDETDIRQTITRIILERLVGYWPQPWGLVLTVVELVKNERYMFFDLPFIKSTPDVAERFASIAQRA